MCVSACDLSRTLDMFKYPFVTNIKDEYTAPPNGRAENLVRAVRFSILETLVLPSIPRYVSLSHI